MVALADRHTGIGCDQLIVLEAGRDVDACMHIRNPDGTQAGACGNATRCVADILMRQTGRDAVVIRTAAGELAATRLGNGLIEVDMGPARLEWDAIPLARPMDTLRLELPGEPAAASMGNPHATFFTWMTWRRRRWRGLGGSAIRCFRSVPILALPRLLTGERFGCGSGSGGRG